MVQQKNPTSISVQQICKRFGQREVLNSITLDVQEGEIFGLLGPSGAGKTTLVKMIAGIDQPSSGVVSVLGTKMPDLDMMKRIGYMAQSDALYAELNARENLDFFAKIYGLKADQRKQRIQHTLELVQLSADQKKAVHQFSGGMKRRLSLAASLLHQPDILILDEPTVGIDPVLRKTIWKELERLRQQGTTLVVTTHVMDEAEKCQRLGMIREGQLIAIGTPDELKKQASALTIEEAFVYFGGEQA